MPNFIELCFESLPCVQPPFGALPVPLLVGYPSRPMTVRTKIPPAGDVVISLSSNGTTQTPQNGLIITPSPVLTFAPGNQLTLTASQPWASFTATSTVYPNQGDIIMTIQSGTGSSYFKYLPPSPAPSISFTTRQITAQVATGLSTLNLVVGVPAQVAVVLDYPPSNPVVINVITQGALNVSGDISFAAGSTIGSFTVTANTYVSNLSNVTCVTCTRDSQLHANTNTNTHTQQNYAHVHFHIYAHVQLLLHFCLIFSSSHVCSKTGT